MKKQILVFTMSQLQSNYEVTRLAEEAEKQGVRVTRALYKDIVFGLNNGRSEVTVNGQQIDGSNTGAIWFRVAGTVSGKYVEGRNLLIRMLRKEVFCANHHGYLEWARMGKISQHGVFVENGIPVVPTRIFYTKKQVWESEMYNDSELGWPIIVKFERGYQGKSVKKFDNQKELTQWLKVIDEKNLGTYLWQKYLTTKWDLRVIVLDGKAVGAMKRSAQGDEFRSNFSLGGEVEEWKLSDSDSELAERTAQVCGLDYCGVDIMKDPEGNSFVLEVNRQCQYKGFEKATGINVAGKVVEMLRKKFQN